MKFGLLFRVQDPPNAENIVGPLAGGAETAQVAEESGFDGVFLPEHHMMPDGYLPSQWPVLGALAAMTERLEIGTTVHLLPFEHPIHIAEHGAMVDILSNGRLRLGVGMGTSPRSSSSSGSNTSAGLALRGGDRHRAARLGGRGDRLRGQALQGQGPHHAHARWRGAVDRRDVRARCAPRRALRLSVADRPAAQPRRHEVLDRPLPGGRRGVRDLRQARRGAAARRLGRRLAG